MSTSFRIVTDSIMKQALQANSEFQKFASHDVNHDLINSPELQ